MTERQLELAVAAAVRDMEPWELLELARALPVATYEQLIGLGAAVLLLDVGGDA